MKRFARGETDSVPLWASVYTFAEQYGMFPADAERRMTVQILRRWQMLEKTKAARAAEEHARIAQDWAKELSSAERELIDWAERDSDNGNES